MTTLAHKFLWDGDGHTCANCGTKRPKASPEQYLALIDAKDRAGEHVSETVSVSGYPLYVFGVSTGSGFVRAIHAFGIDGGDVTRFQINMREVEEVPATFRKFHQLYTPETVEAMRAMFVARVDVVKAETVAACSVN